MVDTPRMRLFRNEATIRIGTSPGSADKTANNPSGLTIISNNGLGRISLPTYFNHLIQMSLRLGTRTQPTNSISNFLKERGSHILMNIGGRTEVVGLPAIGHANRAAGFDYSGVGGSADYPTYNDQPYFKAIERYLSGDHWQDGVAWRGPLPATVDNSPQSTEIARMTMKLIEGAFISRNFHKECLDRHVASVIGLAPTRTIAQVLAEDEVDTETSKAIDGLESGISKFWSFSSVHEHLQKATREACAFETGFVRWYENPSLSLASLGTGSGRRAKKTSPGQKVLEELSKWRFHYVDPKVSSCAVYVDDADVPVAAYYVRLIGDSLYQEFQIIDSSGVTNILSRTTDYPEDEEIPFELRQYDFQGKLLIHAVKRDTIFTPQFNQNVDAINVVYTVAGRSNIQASFVERVITNAQLDGYYADIELPNGQTVKRFVPFKMAGGAGTTKSLQGVPIIDPDSGAVTNITNPGVYWKDPVSMQHFIDSKDLFMENIYAEVGQSHVRINNSTAPSGYARETASQDGSNFLQPTILAVNKTLEWIDDITRDILIGAASAGNAFPISVDMLESLVFNTRCTTIDKIPSTEDKRVARELFDAGIWTFERANYATGAANPAQEKRKMLQERSEGMGNNSYESRQNTIQVTEMNIVSQQKIAKENALRTQANSRSQATTGGGKGSNQAKKTDGTPTGMGAGPNPKKPVSPNTSTPNAGRPSNT